jgi:hypothetical protein
MPTIEEHFAQTEIVAERIEKLGQQLQRAAAAMKKGAREGNPAKIRAAAEDIQALAAQIANAAPGAKVAFPLSDGELAELIKGDFVEQLIAAGSEAGVSLSRLDQCLAAFPVVLQILPDAKGVRIDKTRLASLRPKVIIEKVKGSLKRSRTQPERFIELLSKGYRLVVGANPDHGTTLMAIYEALTLLPESRKTYGKPEFTRDLYELEVSGVRTTSGGQTMTLSAATGTRSKGDTLSIISPEGMPKYYYGIRFEAMP